MNGELRVEVDPSLIRIELIVPGKDSFLELIRAVVGRAARLAGFSFDGIEDFSLVVDEAATLLLSASPRTIQLQLHGSPGSLDARLTAGDPGGPWPPPDLAGQTGWQVLTALCDRVWLLDSGGGVGLGQDIR